ncbi:ParA family protein [Anaplasma marginale]|nr:MULTISPECIES: ParA family protein [Anaplasma]ACZ48834.1 sporulation initiation inhibitor protein [Anaplasma centrale str. Israel]AXW84440.1 ParA family protein [Anaplasma marginale]KAA8472886.1 ParA family protein [Anaplasma marginale]KAA8474995.1 ParA family protein [Anaplasma marginale]KAB0451171.1 ParA family protein [Anaplasma marginale]
MAKVFAVVNQKGGVGKTTTSINLATAFAVVGKSTLMVDLDPQGNSSSGLGIPYSSRSPDIYRVLVDNHPITEAIRSTCIPNLSIVPSTIDLSAAELGLAQMESREFVLKNCLLHTAEYQYVFVDCPPSLGLLTINALAAAHSVIIPMQCEFFALEGLKHLMKTVNLVKKRLNPSLTIEGILLTMYDRRNNLSEQVEENIREHLRENVYKTVIPRNVRLSEAPSHGKPAIIYDYKCPGSQSYIYLAKEILEQQNRVQAFRAEGEVLEQKQ